MDKYKLSRRDFLRLTGLSPLILIPWVRQAPAIAQKGLEHSLPNILILVFDAWSARNVSLYGYPRPTTPNLELLAKRATVYHAHHSAGGFTTPGTASMLTGVYPWTHRALHQFGSTLPRFAENNLFSLLSERYHTFAYTQNVLANLLLYQQSTYIHRWYHISEATLNGNWLTQNWSQKDYGVAYQAERLMFHKAGDFPSSSLFLKSLDWVTRRTADKKVYLENLDAFPYGLPTIRDQGLMGSMFFTLEDTFSWLLQRLKEQPIPFLGYVHLLPPHHAYNTRREFAGRFTSGWQPPNKSRHFLASSTYPDDLLDESRRYYDEYILYVDAEFSRLFYQLDQSGILENTILILTSDHGEMFERGLYQHSTRTLFEPQTHVPLLVFNPGQQERKDIFMTTNGIDLLPSLVEVAGLPIPEWCEGKALPGFIAQPPQSGRSTFAIEAKESPKLGKISRATVAMYEETYKLIHYLGYPELEDRYELFNLKEDPEELNDIFQQESSLARELKSELERNWGQNNRGFDI